MKKFGILILALTAFLQLSAVSSLDEGFASPPSEARARTWWHWLNGNVTREGITADLEAMREAGIRDAQIFCVDMGYPEGPATYLGEHWLGLVRFAASEASRLGLELGFHNSAGWANSGGPWVTPEQAMQKVVFTETHIGCGGHVNIVLPRPEAVRDFYKDIAVLAFPRPVGTERIRDLDYKNLSGRIRNHLQPDTASVRDAAIVRSGDVIDITDAMNADGTLSWHAPEDEWVVLRIGHTTTGTENHPAVTGGRGLEIDKMSAAATDYYWKHGVEPILDYLGDYVGTTVVDCVIDSYEVGAGNWTEAFDSEFENRRGYSMRPFLPTYAGYYIDSPEQTERFLWDYRRTVGDLMAENYYGRFRTLCNGRGLKLYVEPYWGPYDSMQVGDRADMVMCEFWSGLLGAFDSAKFVSSIAHVNGDPLVDAEAFTSYGAWLDYPASIKTVGDKAWAEGVNRFIFHSYTHQPWNIGPGLTFGHYGMDFNRLTTWWKPGRAYLDYVARSQFLLQQGRNVADVLVFAGESAPNDAYYMPEIKRRGYDYDLIGTDNLMKLSCDKGIIRTGAGGEYRLLYMPESRWMTPQVLAKIGDLAENGAVIVGPRPLGSPVLSDYPHCDAETRRLADRLWSAGKVSDMSLTEALTSRLPGPDFLIEGSGSPDITFIHRRTDDADIYFVANGSAEGSVHMCRFRTASRIPELWNAQTGELADAPVWQDNGDGTVSVPVAFEPAGSVFVVFRRPQAADPHIVVAEMKMDVPAVRIPDDLEIVSAEYGSFLPPGMADIRSCIEGHIDNGCLSFHAGNHLGAGDPAPGLIKEFRMAYRLDGAEHTVSASENELVAINMDGKGCLEIISAVYGKYDRGIEGVPSVWPVADVKDTVEHLVSSGAAEIVVGDALTGSDTFDGDNKELRISYKTGGKLLTRHIPAGHALCLGRQPAEARLMRENGEDYWLAPYAGSVEYRKADSKTHKAKIGYVPAEIVLDGPWHVDFGAFDTVFDRLISWPLSDDERIRYFSGTASYSTRFSLGSEHLCQGTMLELDLGDVNVFAEVSVNGKPLGILWKAPYTILLTDCLKEGDNEIEVKITNLWPNRLIGDDFLPEDYEMDGMRIRRWPEWLVSDAQRKSGRSTFTTWKHWDKTAELLPSGLCGPVCIRSYAKVRLE